MPTYDAVLSDIAGEFVSSLEVADRLLFELALDRLLRDPNPDGESKVPLNYFPYSSGVIGANIGEFWITYNFVNATTIGVASVYWSSDSPRRGGELYEA